MPRVNNEEEVPASTKARNWCFTLNNYTEEDAQRIARPYEWVKYVAYSREVAPTTGTPHFQGFLCCWEPQRLSAIKLYLPRAHLEVMHGRLIDNDRYCTKQGTQELIELGERPMQGMRSDLIGFKRRIDRGEEPVQIAEDEPHFGAYVKYHTGMEKYAHHVRAKKIRFDREMPRVYIRIGDSGSGKTKWLDDEFGKGNWARMPNPTSSYWITPTVSRADTVLVDDVGPAKVPKVEEFLEWTDRYPIEFNSKGGHLWWKPKNIVFTSNIHWISWWPKLTDAHKAAVERRIHAVALVYKDEPEQWSWPNGFGPDGPVQAQA